MHCRTGRSDKCRKRQLNEINAVFSTYRARAFATQTLPMVKNKLIHPSLFLENVKLFRIPCVSFSLFLAHLNSASRLSLVSKQAVQGKLFKHPLLYKPTYSFSESYLPINLLQLPLLLLQLMLVYTHGKKRKSIARKTSTLFSSKCFQSTRETPSWQKQDDIIVIIMFSQVRETHEDGDQMNGCR